MSQSQSYREPRVKALVRCTARKSSHTEPDVMAVEEREGPLLLQVTEGIYFGSVSLSGSSMGTNYWFARWDEVLDSTIPLSEAPAGHPLA